MVALWLLPLTAHAGTYSAPTYSGGTVTVTPTPLPKGFGPDGQQGTNASASGSCLPGTAPLTVKATGPITTTFTWQPANAADTAPASVIVQQYCSLVAGGNANSNGTVSASGSNGLGASLSGLGTVSSTQYTAQPANSDGSVTVKCTPTVTVSGTSGTIPGYGTNGHVTVAYHAVVYPVTVNQPTGVTVDPTDQSWKVLTGQQLTASAFTFPTGFKIDPATKYAWSVSVPPTPPATAPTTGDAFYNYDPKDAHNPLKQLYNLGDDPSYTTSPTFSFYDKSGENININCAVTMDAPDGTKFAGTAQSQLITVVKPSVTTWGINTGTGVQKGLAAGSVQAGAQPDNTPDMYATEIWGPITINVPKLGTTTIGGQGCIAQLGLTAADSATRVPVGSYPSTFYDVVKNASGKYIVEPTPDLDSEFPFPFGYTLNGQGVMDFSKNLGTSMWDVSISGYSGDEPETPIFPLGGAGGNNWTQSIFASSFSTYVMYKPPGGVWVPLQMLTWSYSLTAAPSASGFIIDPYNSSLWAVSNAHFLGGTAVNTSTPPTWEYVGANPLLFGPVSP